MKATRSTTDKADPADDDTAAEVKGGEAEEPTSGGTDEDTPPAAGDNDIPPAADDVSAQDSASGDSADEQVTKRSARTHPANTRPVVHPHTTDVHQTADGTDEVEPQTVGLAAVVDNPAPHASAQSSARVSTTLAPTSVVAPAVPQQPKKTLVGVVSDFVASVLQPLLSPGKGSPIQMPILSAVLSLVRNEFERIFAPRNGNVASQQTTTLLTDPPSPLVDPTQQHVLVIGVDGTNLSRILADDYNQNFFDLMDTSTTAAASIVGHTTISNPSWTAILTGVWGERTGVINNVFTPGTYDKFPTVFNQLETLDPDIETMAVGDWDVINAIANAGSRPADENVYVPQIVGDTNWLDTDDAVADTTVDAIKGVNGPTPNFLFSYFVGVDENGHMYGGASPQYAEAIRNMNDNLGEIMDAVTAREQATGEDWTVIVVTDHGHMAPKGFGHGFQSPDETATFVIADGPNFKDGYVNLQYQIVDTTPTVVSLFGGTPRAGSDGVPLTTLGGSDVHPADLKQALEDAIAANDYPDFVTGVALGLRTIFATIPYYVYTFEYDTLAGLPSSLVVPVKILFDGLYVITNVPAQLVALLTGVTGASILPLVPPAAPVFPPSDDTILLDSANLVCAGATGSAAEPWCAAASVA